MQQPNLRRHEPAETSPDQILAARYGQLMQWAKTLTRGDLGKAEEVVQEFCLYITLTKPDLSRVVNLHGYLYTCLRHIYLSSLNRASREALHFVSIEEFDSFAFAVSAQPAGDLLQRQNDLRRICSYAVWRKESSKSASYFILHFFHGYSRSEIAAVAQLPMAAIYNKLKAARSETGAYLLEPGKLRLVNRDMPPSPALSWSVLSTFELFRELRETILRARHSDCLAEEALLANYRAPVSKPISCALLAHIVSCERCLSLVDRHFRRPTLRDREPLDVFGFSSHHGGDTPIHDGGFAGVERSVRSQWARVHEHRPRNLSIALNGQIVANHDVRAEHNRLSARLEQRELDGFVEVFSEQNVRLALLAVGEAPPDGPPLRTQRVALSDQRWLELTLTFDALGIESEVAYFDPALAASATWVDTEDVELTSSSPARTPQVKTKSASRLLADFLRPMVNLIPSSAMAWAIVLLLVIGSAGFFAYRHRYAPTDAVAILHESIRLQQASLQGQTEHQVVRLEEVSGNGRVLHKGEVDLWKDGNGGRSIRRLFDAQHRVMASEWHNKTGQTGTRADGRTPGTEHSSLGAFWNQELSAEAFAALGEGELRVRALSHGYELTKAGPSATHPQLVSATLTLDHNLQPVRQTLRVRVGSEIHELRFVQASYERKPSGSVPDAIFRPESDSPPARSGGHRSGMSEPRNLTGEGDTRLAELQIAVLYELHELGADTAVPIEVRRTSDGRLSVSGTVPTGSLKRAIESRLRALPNHELLDLALGSSTEMKSASALSSRSPRSTRIEAYEVAQPGFAADARIRSYFQARGFVAEHLDEAVAQFSKEALQHAQRALQHAYALDRLATSLSANELRSVSVSTQKEWTQMANNHATELESELRLLHGQLGEIAVAAASPAIAEPMRIDEPEQFARAASVLLQQVRALNRQVGDFFTSSGKPAGSENLDAALKSILATIPLRQAEELTSFTVRLDGTAREPNTAAHAQ